MIQNGLIVISLLASVLGLFRPVTLFDDVPLNLGAITYPTALDAFENPTASQPVSQAVTHSTQHSNANDALEALQAKLGISASTAIANSILAGNGAGSSIWTTFATTTNLSTTDLQTGTLLATGSTTLQSFTAIQSTTSQATTTSIFSTTASSTRLYGAGLQSCSGVNFLQWSAGQFGCVEASSGGATIVSTSTQQQLATTTFSVAAGTLPDSDVYEFTVMIPTLVGSASTTQQTLLVFNGDHDANNYLTSRLVAAVHGNITNTNGVLLDNTGPAVTEAGRYITVKIANYAGMPKRGSFSVHSSATSSPVTPIGGNIDGVFTWSSQSDITQIDFGFQQANVFFATSTRFKIESY